LHRKAVLRGKATLHREAVLPGEATFPSYTFVNKKSVVKKPRFFIDLKTLII
jgi:citrate lyase synthetase